MRTRSVLALAVPLLLLSACAPSEPDDFPEPPTSPKPSATQEADVAIELPADGVLGLVATATAGNGAVLDIEIVVHQAVPSTNAPDAVAATEAWCAGEMDGQILADQGYSLTAADVTATLVSGEWPSGASLLVYPEPRANAILVASGVLAQVPNGSEGDYTPHCVTPVTLPGPGAGSVLVGIVGDVDGDADGTPPLGGVGHLTFGVGVALPDGTVADVTIGDCAATVSDLGTGLGVGTAADWNERLDDPAACTIGAGMG